MRLNCAEISLPRIVGNGCLLDTIVDAALACSEYGENRAFDTIGTGDTAHAP
jgi:hypothetical protein